MNKKLIYDEIRQDWVKASPEELVRQHWIQKMVQKLDFPKELIVVEKGIAELPHLAFSETVDRRIDILCYGKEASSSSLFPLLLIECKDECFTEDAVNQVIGYNHHVKAHFIAVVNLDQVRFGTFDASENKYIFCSFLPSFKELMQWVNR